MKKFALLLLIAAVAAAPAMAATKKKHRKMHVATAQKVDPNEASWRLVRDGFPLILPSWALRIYFSHRDAEAKTPKYAAARYTPRRCGSRLHRRPPSGNKSEFG
jgi:hypothetical protein